MGQTGFCKNLRFSAVSCKNLRFPAVFCANLRLPNPLIYRASRKAAKICKNLRKCALRVRFLPFAVSLSLIFLSLLFWKKQGKPTQKSKDFFSVLNPRILGKEGKNDQKSKEIPCNEKRQGNPKKQGKEDQGLALPDVG